MLSLLRPAILLFTTLSAMTGLAYPLVVTIICTNFFPFASGGSIVEISGRPVGSVLIGQQFTGPGYFWGRPSATLPQPYNAAASGGSNLGPLNPALSREVSSRMEMLKQANPETPDVIPIDLVTSSASGLDPHISPAAAHYQAERVARARHLNPEWVHKLIEQLTENRQFGLFGEPRINVLRLNMALEGAR